MWHAHFLAGNPPQQVNRGMIDRCKIGRRIPCSDAAIVLSEGDIQNPMQTIFHLPVVRMYRAIFSALSTNDDMWNRISVLLSPHFVLRWTSGPASLASPEPAEQIV